MSYYFIGMIEFDEGSSKKEYEEYVALAKPILEKYKATYLAKTEEVLNIQEILEKRSIKGGNSKEDMEVPDKVIIVRFPDKKHLQSCFQSEEYQAIMQKRINNVKSRGIVVGGFEDEDK